MEPTLSSAERRRQERRQKILSNRESRFKKILGENSSEEQIQNLLKTSSLDEDEGVWNEGISEIGDTPRHSDPPIRTHLTSSKVVEDEPESIRRIGKTKEERFSIVPSWLHKLILFLLGVSLPVLGGDFFLVYFFAWEMAFIVMRKKEEEINSSAVTGVVINVVFIVLKVSEEWRNRIKVIFKQTYQITSDLSLFVASSLFISMFLPVITQKG